PHRRIFSEAFLNQASRVLNKGGILQLRTDSFEYFEFVKNLSSKFTNVFKINFDKNAKNAVISKYEARWIREQKDIFNIEFYATQESKEKTLDFNFSFLDSTLPHIEAFKKIKFIEKDYFLHIEELFLGQKNKLLKITFGDFNYPESRYILENKAIKYFRNDPLPTKINHKAHKMLLNSLKDSTKETL
ncbi:MAG: tRNA (guanosine(46)-N7)-methyltransferase TrmB, partial [Helicobacter sp.]|nr:tRNA (guanosine(46)-N7)-methyltransferase TrmB [Helicobacter sp.]